MSISTLTPVQLQLILSSLPAASAEELIVCVAVSKEWRDLLTVSKVHLRASDFLRDCCVNDDSSPSDNECLGPPPTLWDCPIEALAPPVQATAMALGPGEGAPDAATPAARSRRNPKEPGKRLDFALRHFVPHGIVHLDVAAEDRLDLVRHAVELNRPRLLRACLRELRALGEAEFECVRGCTLKDCSSGIHPLTLVAHAAKEGFVEVLHELLAAGFEVNTQCGLYEVTALYAACTWCPCPELRAACVKALLEAGASVDLADCVGFTPLFRSVQLADVRVSQLLLEAGADPEAENEDGDTVADVAEEHADLAALVRGHHRVAGGAW